MPNFSKLIAAVCLGALGFVLSEMIMVLEVFEEDFNFGYFTMVNIILGMFIGWTWVGQKAGRGLVMAINNGFTGVVLMMLFGVAIQGGNEMLRLALRSRYDTAFEAIIAMFDLSLKYFLMVSTLPIWMVAVAGGVGAGLLCEMAARRRH